MPDNLLADLRRGFGDELVGLSDFARLLGLSPARAAQLRTDRNRDPEFPSTVRDSGRSHVHRLSSLIDWYLGSDRLADFGETDPIAVHSWRLGTGLATRTDPARRDAIRGLLLAVAVIRRDDAFGDLFGSTLPTVSDLLDRARSFGDGRPRRRGSNLIDPPLARDVATLTALIEDAALRVDVAVLLVAEVDALWAAVQPTTARHDRFADAVDTVAASLATEQRADPHRSAAVLGAAITVALAPRHGDVVYEPTCGECEVLVDAGRVVRVGDGPEGPELLAVGRDRDISAITIGRARLALFGVQSSLGEPGFDSRRFGLGAAVGADRMLIDPGPGSDDMDEWLHLIDRHLAAKGRVAIVIPLDRVNAVLLRQLPPLVLVVLPVGAAAGVPGVAALWVHDRSSADVTVCRVVDLRRRPAPDVPFEQRLVSFAEAVGHHDPDGLVAAADLLDPLAAVLAERSHVDEVPIAELAWRALSLADSPIRGIDDEVVLDDNRAYALHLASELERLIDGYDPNPSLGRARRIEPAVSPDGVLADESTEEARRVLRRVVDGLAGERRGRRGKRPGR